MRRVHMLAWRDLDDVEAGGSELHADRVARLWAEAGIEVTARTSYAAGGSSVARRSGYRVIRRGGRYMVFPRAVLAELAGLHGPRDGLVEIWNGMPFLSPLWARGRRAAWVHQPHTDLWDRVLPKGRAAAGRVFERDLAPWLYRGTPVVTLSESVRSQAAEAVPLRARAGACGAARHRRPLPARNRHRRVVRAAAGGGGPADRVQAVQPSDPTGGPAAGAVSGPAGGGRHRRRARPSAGAGLGTGRRRLVRAGPARVDDDALVRLYQQASALVSASASEGWGMTITEAAACGTPAVVSDIPGHADAVIDGETGYLAARDADFVDALERVVGDPAHRTRLGDAARARAARLTWERTAYDTLAVLVGEPSRQPR